MTSPTMLNASASTADVVLVEAPVPQCNDAMIKVLREVSEPMGWSSAYWSERQLQEWLNASDARRWLICVADENAGFVELRYADNGTEVEIKMFGLVDRFKGQGIGSAALTQVVRLAWGLGPTVNRVWLSTTSRDGPAALPNYTRRGFVQFDCTKSTKEIDGRQLRPNDIIVKT